MQTRIKVVNSKEDAKSDQLNVHCKNLTDLLNQIFVSRKISSEFFPKLGIDGGKGFLKFRLGVVAKDPLTDEAFRSKESC